MDEVVKKWTAWTNGRKHVVIYGAGAFSRSLMAHLSRRSLRFPDVILDDNFKDSYLYGVPVLQSDLYFQQSKHSIPDEIMLSLNSREAYEKIVQSMTNLGLKVASLVEPESMPCAIPESPDDSRELLLFYHVPKCAGTSLMRVLGKNYGSAFRQVILPDDWEKTVKDREVLARHKKICLAGHHVLGIEKFFPEFAPSYFTIVREPGDLFASWVRYCLDIGADPLSRSFLDYVGVRYSEKLGGPVNIMTNWLGQGSLEHAKNFIDQCACVGLQEDFELSLRLFAYRFGLANWDAPRANASNKTGRHDRPDVERYLQESNDDLALYDYCRRRFLDETAKIQHLAAKPGIKQELSQSSAKKELNPSALVKDVDSQAPENDVYTHYLQRRERNSTFDTGVFSLAAQDSVNRRRCVLYDLIADNGTMNAGRLAKITEECDSYLVAAAHLYVKLRKSTSFGERTETSSYGLFLGKLEKLVFEYLLKSEILGVLRTIKNELKSENNKPFRVKLLPDTKPFAQYLNDVRQQHGFDWIEPVSGNSTACEKLRIIVYDNRIVLERTEQAMTTLLLTQTFNWPDWPELLALMNAGFKGWLDNPRSGECAGE